MKRILLAIGNSEYSKIIRNFFATHGPEFTILEQEIIHHQYLEEIVAIEKPDILMIHDYYLPTDAISKEEREIQWLHTLQKLRREYDDTIRVVFLCEREKGDPFLSHLVSCNVLDIFSGNSISMKDLVEQLRDIPRYSRVAKYRTSITNDLPIVSQLEISQETDTKEEVEPNRNRRSEKTSRPIVKKVVEKKVVNKQVIKRDYHIQFLNHVEKTVGISIDRKLIMVGSPFSRSGSTFVSHLIAREIAKYDVSVSYIENPYADSYTYDRFMGHLFDLDYRSKFYEYTLDENDFNQFVYDWPFNGVNMIVKRPTEEPNYSEDDITFDLFVKVLLSSQTTITIIDVGTDWQRDIYKDLFDIATDAFLILEPDISNIQFLLDPDNKRTEFYRDLIQQDKVNLIGNRFTDKLLKNDVIHELSNGEMEVIIPEFSSEEVFGAHYKGQFLNDIPSFQGIIKSSLYPIILNLLPEEIIEQNDKRNLLQKVFNKRINIEKV